MELERLKRAAASSSFVVVVEDEPAVADGIVNALRDEGYEVKHFASAEGLLQKLDQLPADLLLSDVWLPGVDGLDLLEQVKGRRPELPVIIMSGHGTIETAVKATRLGAYDFLEKPLATERLLVTVKNAIESDRNRQRAEALVLINDQKAPTILGQSAVVRKLLEEIKLASQANAPVLVLGENGVGKELVARQIHGLSRVKGPLIEVNCAAIPDDLLESELFGHERGAFTGATATKKGKFEIANGGTLFLDEIGDMSVLAQAKVLRVLQEGTFVRVGGAALLKSSARVVAATNKDLSLLIKEGTFREDLYYRLNVVKLKVPPLRERPSDVPELANWFLSASCRRQGRQTPSLTQEVLLALRTYQWPGNVRELRNTMERLAIMCPGETISWWDLPEEMQTVAAAAEPQGADREPAALSGTLREARADFERRFIEQKLKDADGNMAKAAQILGLDRTALYRKMKTLGMKDMD